MDIFLLMAILRSQNKIIDFASKSTLQVLYFTFYDRLKIPLNKIGGHFLVFAIYEKRASKFTATFCVIPEMSIGPLYTISALFDTFYVFHG